MASCRPTPGGQYLARMTGQSTGCVENRVHLGLDLDGAADMRMQRRGDSFGGDGRSSRTQPVDDAAKGRLACVGTNGWVCHPFRSETGGDEDLGVAELGVY